MVTPITAYRDTAGNVHTDALSAHRADLAHWFEQLGVVNAASAAQLANRLTSDRDCVLDLIDSLNEAAQLVPDPVFAA